MRVKLLLLMMVFGLGCGESTQDVAIQFQALAGDQSLECGSVYSGLGSSSSDFTYSGLRYYVHGVELLTTDGSAVTLMVNDDGKWQKDGVVLLDFEDGSSTCADSGNPDTNNLVNGVVPEGDYNGIRFVLGVPFDMNHADVATAPAPLNVTSMFWNWNGGYKFLRLEGATTELPGFRFHLGSVMCDGDMMGNVTACAGPNRPVIELTGFDPTTNKVGFDLAALLSGADLSTNADMTPEGCMGPDPDCIQLFNNVGLPFMGTPTAGQTAFVVK